MPDYDTDVYGWATEQAALLRAGRLEAIDTENIAEEIESIGRSEKRVLVHRLTVLLLHLLKWQFQPNMQGRSWTLTIDEQRLRLKTHLADNPSLGPKLGEAFEQAFTLAVIRAERETGLDAKAFPSSPPWSSAQAMADGFYP